MALSLLIQNKTRDKTQQLELGHVACTGPWVQMFCRSCHPNKCLFITKTFKFWHGVTCLQSYLLRRQTHGEWMLGARLGYRANSRLAWAT